jgi:hypothetical protein
MSTDDALEVGDSEFDRHIRMHVAFLLRVL